MATAKTRFTIPFRELGLTDIARGGGKHASLSRKVTSDALPQVIRALAPAATRSKTSGKAEAPVAQALS